MEIDQAAEMSREAVGIFHTPECLQGAIDELLSSGFHRAELSLLASEAAIMEKLGHLYTKADMLADDPDVPRAAYVAGEDIGDAEGGMPDERKGSHGDASWEMRRGASAPRCRGPTGRREPGRCHGGAGARRRLIPRDLRLAAPRRCPRHRSA